MIWFIWFVLFIWLVSFNQTNQINKRNKPGFALHELRPVSPPNYFRTLLGIGDDVRIRFFYPFNLVNLCDHHIGEGSFVRDTDEQNNVRPSKAGVGLFDTGEALEELQHIFRPPGFDLD